MAIELKHDIEQRLDITLHMASLFEGDLAAITEEILRQIVVAPAIRFVEAMASDHEQSEYRLSHGQKALWLLQRLSPDSGAYNLASAVRIRGDLDIVALERAFQALIDRHALLRTSFESREGMPIQRVHNQVAVCFETEDATAWSDSFLHDRLSELSCRSFNLERDSLLQAIIFLRSSNEHIALFVVHHIVADFWSLEIIVRELAILYSCYKKERASSTPILQPLSLQYKAGRR
jgi:hypothetical protein